MNSSQSDVIFKICIFGDGGVGKSTLVKRYLSGLFDESTSMTIGLDCYSKKLEFKDITVSLQIWDFAGEKRFRFLLPSYVSGASGGIFMYDITRTTSLNNFTDWLNVFRNGFNVKNHETKLPIMMVGGKLDLSEKRSIPRKFAEEIVENENLFSYIECSAKTGENVEDIFQEIAKYLLILAKIH